MEFSQEVIQCEFQGENNHVYVIGDLLSSNTVALSSKSIKIQFDLRTLRSESHQVEHTKNIKDCSLF